MFQNSHFSRKRDRKLCDWLPSSSLCDYDACPTMDLSIKPKSCAAHICTTVLQKHPSLQLKRNGHRLITEHVLQYPFFAVLKFKMQAIICIFLKILFLSPCAQRPYDNFFFVISISLSLSYAIAPFLSFIHCAFQGIQG